MFAEALSAGLSIRNQVSSTMSSWFVSPIQAVTTPYNLAVRIIALLPLVVCIANITPNRYPR